MRQAAFGTFSGAMLGLALFSWSPQASAGVLYDNGPLNGTNDAFTLDFGFALADSFTLSQSSTVTGVNFGVWSLPGDTMTSIDWGITSTANIFPDQGTALVTNGSTSLNGFGYNIGVDSFSIPSTTLAAGTYWLVLQNAVVSNGDPIYWDQNDGPSTAYHNNLGYLSDGGCGGLGQSGQGTCSESFQILGSVSATPLPSTWTMLIAGFVGLFGFVAFGGKKRNTAATAAA
jgi:hypothetical protein